MEQHSGFRDVDKVSNPTQFVNYLDSVSSLDVAQSYKKRTFTLLNIKEGDAVLDVGCGPGDDAQSIAKMVGSTGRVVGVDYSEAMITEAEARNSKTLPVEFLMADAHALEFEDNSFDACRTDRTLQHVEDPQKVLSEMARVTRPGGYVVASDPDWGTLTLDHPDRELTRIILNSLCDEDIRNGWIGRQLPGLLNSVGVNEIRVETFSALVADYQTAADALLFESAAQRMSDDGLITQAERDQWIGHLEAA